MAFTVTKNYLASVGNIRESAVTVTADAASGVVDSGLAVVLAASLVPISMATAGIKVKINLSAASAAANGQIMVSSAVSGDLFQLVCKGR